MAVDYDLVERSRRLPGGTPRKRTLVQRLRTRVVDWAQRHPTALLAGTVAAATWIVSHIYYYNVLVDFELHVDTARSQIVVAQQKRDHVRRSLTQLLRFHASYERSVLEQVTKLRAPGAHADKTSPRDALANVDAVGEQYPTLQIDSTVSQLSDAVVATEVEVASRIAEYNDAVNIYTNYLHQFPGNVFAPTLGFRDRDYFPAEDPSRLEYREVAP